MFYFVSRLVSILVFCNHKQVFDKHKKNRQRGSAELQRINEGKGQFLIKN